MSIAVIASAFAPSITARSPASEIGVLRELRRVSVDLLRRDGDGGMDAGDDLADVTHVGAAKRAWVLVVRHLAADGGEVAAAGRGNRRICVHRRVLVHVPVQLQRRAGRLRARLEARGHANLQLFEVLVILGAHEEAGGGVPGDDIRRFPAIGDHAVDAGGAADVLPERVDGVVGDDHRFERIDAALRLRRGVRLAPVVLDAQLGAGERPGDDAVARTGMRHDRGVEAVERALADHRNLAAVDLFGGRADDVHAALQIIDHGADAGARARRRRGDDVVAAAVADAGERIVLGKDGDRRCAVTGDGAKRRRQVGDARRDIEALVAQEARQPFAGLELLERKLRVGVDAMTERNQTLRLRIDGGAGAGFQCVNVHGAQRTADT